MNRVQEPPSGAPLGQASRTALPPGGFGGGCGWGWGTPALKGSLSWLDVVRAGLLPAAAFPAAGSTWQLHCWLRLRMRAAVPGVLRMHLFAGFAGPLGPALASPPAAKF